jgi:predicted nucleic acid-binding protein
VSFLLDTNVVSEWVKPRPEPRVVAWLAAVDEDEVFLSVVSFAELGHGVGLMPAGQRRRRLLDWIAHDLTARFDGRVLDIDRRVADAWGQLMARSRHAGRALGAMDGFFAATAVSYDLTLVTRNIRDFHDLGLPLHDPWEGAPAG